MARWGQVECRVCGEEIYMNPKIIYGPHCKPCWVGVLTEVVRKANEEIRQDS